MKIPVEVSARHFHATEEDYRVLFGDVEPKIMKELSQKGQFASDKEAELIVGDQVLSVRFLGPFRDFTQVEITKTDAFKLKINPPVAECICSLLEPSGEVFLGGKAILRGPNGQLDKNMVIISLRHLHINTTKADDLGIKPNQYVKIAVGEERRAIFEKVLCRVSDEFSFDVHLDTDEANAAGISSGDQGELIL